MNNIDIVHYENDDFVHKDMSEEIAFLYLVTDGDLAAIKNHLAQEDYLNDNGRGMLAKNAVTNLKYHTIIITAVITRMCIQNGMENERACRMSDYYIRLVDNSKTIEEITKIHDNLILDFTLKMSVLKKQKSVSKPVGKALNYIYAHIHERITIKKLAEYASVSTSYLSKQFSDEIGIPVSEYIKKNKIERSQEDLIKSEKSILDISIMYSFSSESHYIQSFKDVVGMTPKKYRSTYSIP